MKTIITLTNEEIRNNMNNEAMARRKLIDSVLDEKWEVSEKHFICSEFIFSAIEEKKMDIPDYLCVYNRIYPLAVVEAKSVKNTLKTEGNVKQLRRYCEFKNIPFGYLTNGLELIEFDFITNEISYMKIDDFPTGGTLWERYLHEQEIARQNMGESYLDGLIKAAEMEKRKFLPYQLILYPFEYIYPKEKRNMNLFLDVVFERFYAYQVEHNSFEINTLVLVDKDDIADVYEAFKYYASGDYLLKDENYVMTTYENDEDSIVKQFMFHNRPRILVTDKNPFSNKGNSCVSLILNLKKKSNLNEYHKLFVANVENEDKLTVIDFTLSINQFGLPNLNLVKEKVVQRDEVEKDII